MLGGDSARLGVVGYVLHRHSQIGQQWQALDETVLYERRQCFLSGSKGFHYSIIPLIATPLADLIVVLL
jgi:hypothetical protein